MPSKKTTTKIVSSEKQITKEQPSQDEKTQEQPSVQLSSTNVETEFKKKYNILYKGLLASKKEAMSMISESHNKTIIALKELLTVHNFEMKHEHVRKHKKNGNRPPSGFNKPRPVPERLAKFIGVKSGDELSGPQITSKIWEQFHTRHLMLETDKRVLRTDEEIRDLFKIPASVDNSTDRNDVNGLNFKTLPKYIKNAYLPATPVPEPKKVSKTKTK